MKKLSLVLNIVLALAVIALYILHFTGIGSTKKSKSDAGLSAAVQDGSGIYYVQIDSVLSKFDMAKDLSGELEAKFNSSDATLKSKQQSYQKEVEDYQYKVQRQLITRSEAQSTEQLLYAKQQDLMKLQQDLTNEISEKQSVMNRQVINAIMEYMKNNCSQYNYRYVLGASFGGNILYANDSLDITKNIITGLNEEYRKNKKKD